MVYLISRSLCQGRAAGVMSWFGVVLGFTVHMLCAAVGLTALFMAVPLGYELLKLAGALYLLWLAWQAVRPGSRSPFEARKLPPEPSRKLFMMGLLTSVLNPKVAVFYLSVLPQFISPESGSVLAQSILLGVTQVCIGSTVNLIVTLSAAAIAALVCQKPILVGSPAVRHGPCPGRFGVQAAHAATQRGITLSGAVPTTCQRVGQARAIKVFAVKETAVQAARWPAPAAPTGAPAGVANTAPGAGSCARGGW